MHKSICLLQKFYVYVQFSTLGNIRQKQFRLLVSIILFCGLSVTFMHCAETTEVDTISFACDSPMSLTDHVKIWHTLVNPFLPIFCPKVTHPCWFERRRHSMANCGRIEIAMETGGPIGNHLRSFAWYNRRPPMTSPFSILHPPGPTSRRVPPPGKYNRRAVSCAKCHYEPYRLLPNYFGPCLVYLRDCFIRFDLDSKRAKWSVGFECFGMRYKCGCQCR